MKVRKAHTTLDPNSIRRTNLSTEEISNRLAAIRVLASLHGSSDLSSDTSAPRIECQQIKHQLQLEVDEGGKNLLQVLISPRWRKRMIMGFLVQFLMQSTGILVIFNYQVRTTYSSSVRHPPLCVRTLLDERSQLTKTSPLQILMYNNLGLTGSIPLLLLALYNAIAAFMNWLNSLILDRWGRIRMMSIGLVRWPLPPI